MARSYTYLQEGVTKLSNNHCYSTRSGAFPTNPIWALMGKNVSHPGTHSQLQCNSNSVRTFLNVFSLPFVHKGVHLDPGKIMYFSVRISVRNFQNTCIHLRKKKIFHLQNGGQNTDFRFREQIHVTKT